MPPSPRPRRAVPTAVLAAVLLAVLRAVPAGADLVAEPATLDGGTLSTVSLTWQEGCGGSPTRQLTVALPAGATEVRLLPPEGWDATGPAGEPPVATFTARPGAEVADGARAAVGLQLRVPEGAGRLAFPTVQTCVAGEQAWTGGGGGAGRPAPSVEVVGEAGADSHDTEDDEHTTTSIQVAGPVPPPTLPPVADAAADDGDGGLGAARLAGIVVAAVALGLVGGIAVRRREGSSR